MAHSKEIKKYGEYLASEVLGRGSYGTVYKAEKNDGSVYKRERIYYALKVIDTKGVGSKIWTMIEREQTILKQLTHPNIVLLKDSFFTSDCLCLVMEYCDGGTLYWLLRETGTGLEEDIFIQYLKQISEGVKYLHGKDIIHRDIKSKNLLLCGENHDTIKIADFGVSRIVSENTDVSKLSKFVGTVFVMSPEMINHQTYDNKTDIWSIGCTCVEMGTAMYAFDGKNLPQIKKLVKDRNVIGFDKVPYCDDIKKLILQMLSLDPKDRPSIGMILRTLKSHADTHTTLRRHSHSGYPSETERVSDPRSVQTLPVNTLTATISSINAENEKFERDLQLLITQSARLQSDLVIEIGYKGADKVAKIINYYLRYRQEKAEREAQKLLGSPIFERLKYLFRALREINTGINELKERLGEEDEDLGSTTSSLASSLRTM